MKPKANRSQRELVQALATLRLLIREVGGNYLAALQAEAAHLEQTVRQAAGAGEPGRRQRAQMAAMLRLINELNVKPERGRRRDLKELDQLLGRLAEIIEDW